jgi:hypothetical protein
LKAVSAPEESEVKILQDSIVKDLIPPPLKPLETTPKHPKPGTSHPLATTKEQIQQNMLRLEEYRHSKDRPGSGLLQRSH